MRFITIVIVAFIVGVAIFIGWWFIGPESLPTPTPSTEPVAQAPAKDTYKVIVVQASDTERRILSCSDICRSLNPIASSSDAPVTDGEVWYRYRDVEDTKTKETKRVLEKVPLNTPEPTTLVEETDLVRPHGLAINPTGTRVAYYLDNVDTPKEELTEIWAYDAAIGGTRLLVENVHVPDLVTPPRWNKRGNFLWFTQKNDKGEVEFKVAGVQPVGVNTQFSQLDWKALGTVAGSGVMDVSFSGKALAFVESATLPKLTVVNEAGERHEQVVNGTVPYIEWAEDGSLLYAVQSTDEIAWWRLKGKVPTLLTRTGGTLQAAHGDEAGKAVVFAAQVRNTRPRLWALDATSARLSPLLELPVFGTNVYIVHVTATPPAQSSVAGIITKIPDEELLAFVEHHLPAIAGVKDAVPERVIVTDQNNTVFVDYKNPNAESARILLSITSTAKPDWSVRARYVGTAGDWRKVEGGGVREPQALRRYEWEAAIEQWILK